MPTTPEMVHSQGVLPDFVTRGGVRCFFSNGCVCAETPEGINTLTGSRDAEAWIREHVDVTPYLEEMLRRSRYLTHDSRPRPDCKGGG